MRNLFHALTEGGDPDTPDYRPKLRNVSPNQFALPGMEHMAHPGAKFLPKGISFHFQTEQHPGGVLNPAFPDLSRSAEHRHILVAHKMSPATFNLDRHIGNTLGELHWAGEHEARPETHGSGHYPGEITWVQRGYAAERHKGLMASMFHMGHQVNMGQSTVPVHSPDRTAEGEEWSAKVGPAHLRPKHGDYDWRPPHGVHPYQQRNIQPRQFNNPKGSYEQHLPGMDLHSLSRQHREFLTKKRAQEDEAFRRSGEPF